MICLYIKTRHNKRMVVQKRFFIFVGLNNKPFRCSNCKVVSAKFLKTSTHYDRRVKSCSIHHKRGHCSSGGFSVRPTDSNCFILCSYLSQRFRIAQLWGTTPACFSPFRVLFRNGRRINNALYCLLNHGSVSVRSYRNFYTLPAKRLSDH